MSKLTLPKVTDIGELKGQYVLLRASLNVPIADGVVSNQFRIARALPTINYLRTQGARVVIMAHIGREPSESLQPVYEAMRATLPVSFCPQVTGGEATSMRNDMQDGDVLLLENVRQDLRETANDINFATDLALLGDIYVNDAFAASHRAHASIVGVPTKLPSYFGMNFIHEYEELRRAMEPQAPSLFVLGGAKFDTKMPLIEKYLDHYDEVFVGGALAHDIFKARGLEVGASLVSDIDLTDNPLLDHPKLLVPVDVTVKNGSGVRVCRPEEVTKEEVILDAGPATIEMLTPLVAKAKTILWNGPLGNFENGFGKETEALGKLIADASGYAVLGGGDTIAAIESLGVQEKFGFLSTAGGAMLNFMEAGTLPGIEAVITKN